MARYRMSDGTVVDTQKASEDWTDPAVELWLDVPFAYEPFWRGKNCPAVQKRFAAETGIPLGDVVRLVIIAEARAEIATRECNGDPHPKAKDRHDKNECGKLWGEQDDHLRAALEQIAAAHGCRMDYPGLYPHLTDRDGRDHMLPYGDDAEEGGDNV